MSLYHQSVETCRKLIQLPGFRDILQESIATEVEFSLPSKDPVTQLWHCFRFGNSLCFILNSYRANTIVDINPLSDSIKNRNLSKVNVYHFLSACKALGLKTDLFSISELYNDDTGGFIKVLNVVNEILDRMEQEGIFSFTVSSADQQNVTRNRASSSIESSIYDRVIWELLETERKYVQDLETLQNYMHLLQQREILSKHTLTQIFSNLNNLLDFERKFLISLEDECLKDPTNQHIGNLFIENEEAFGVYAPFCANYQHAADTVLSHKESMEGVEGGIEPTRELASFLIKPIQRICKFPLLLRELVKNCPPAGSQNEELLSELKEAQYAMERVTTTINEARRREENKSVVTELATSVEDWKGLRIQEFGDLLLHGSMIMQRREIEKEVHMFLFEQILICCKENKKEKSRTRSIIRRSNSSSVSSISYTLKGRVAISGVEGIVAASRNGHFDLKIFFKDNDTGEMESVVLKFIHEEPLRKWQSEIESLLDRKKRRSAPAGRDRRRRYTAESQGSRRRTAAQPPSNLKTNLEPSLTDVAPRSAAGTPDRLSIARKFQSTHISPLSSPMPLNDTEEELPAPPRRLTKHDYTSEGKPLQNLDRFLSDLEEALREGAFEDTVSNNMVSNVDNVPPPLPLVPSLQTGTASSSTRTSLNLPPPPSHPVPSTHQVKLKVRTSKNNDIFMFLVEPDMSLGALEEKVKEKAGPFHRMKYQDEDGDYITLAGNDDLTLAFRLCSVKGVMNLYIDEV